MDECCIELSDIIDYVGSFTRPKKLGEELAKAKHHFVFFGRRLDLETQPSEIRFEGVCLTSTIANPPHTVSVVKHTSEAEKTVTLQGKCSCKAGSSQCKHIVGLMLKLHR
jgi:hypothetical protein